MTTTAIHEYGAVMGTDEDPGPRAMSILRQPDYEIIVYSPGSLTAVSRVDGPGPSQLAIGMAAFARDVDRASNRTPTRTGDEISRGLMDRDDWSVAVVRETAPPNSRYLGATVFAGIFQLGNPGKDSRTRPEFTFAHPEAAGDARVGGLLATIGIRFPANRP